MRDLYLIRCLCVFSAWLFSLGVAYGQRIDTTAYHELSGVEVVEKARPSVTREGTPLQVMTGRESIAWEYKTYPRP